MMKVKKTTLKIAVCLLMALMLSAVLVACDQGDEGYRYEFLVTFDYNEGNLVDEDGALGDQWLGIKEANSLISIRPGYHNMMKEKSIRGYYIVGWYLPQVDEEGNAIKDENGFVLLDKEWDFATQRVSGPTTLYAKFVKEAAIHFIDRADGQEVGGSISGKPGTTRNKPSKIGEPTKPGATFWGKYYEAMTGDKEFEWPYVFGTEDINVYVEFIDGAGWNFVEDEDTFVRILNAGGSIYLMDDLDFTGKTLWGNVTYNAEINGNGHVVKGIKRDLESSKGDTENMGGVFGALGPRAYIHDITFEDVDVTYMTWVNPAIDLYVGLFAWKAEATTKIKNVTLKGTLSYDTYNGGVVGSKWIAIDQTKSENIIDCDYSQVNIMLQD